MTTCSVQAHLITSGLKKTSSELSVCFCVSITLWHWDYCFNKWVESAIRSNSGPPLENRPSPAWFFLPFDMNPSSENQGSQSGREKRWDESFQLRSKERTRTWKLSSHLFSRPGWLPLGLRGWHKTVNITGKTALKWMKLSSLKV